VVINRQIYKRFRNTITHNILSLLSLLPIRFNPLVKITVNLEKQELEYWLALARAPGVGPVRFAQLLKRFDSPQGVFAAFPHDWISFGLKQSLIDYLQQPDWTAVAQDMAWSKGVNNHIITLAHPSYPIYLRQIYDPPPVLFVHGDIQLLSQSPLAIVGSRQPSFEGDQTARSFAEILSRTGFTIVSGLAFGIDAASHTGALAGTGKTVAVAGTGLDQVYPAQHLKLAHQIAEKGALISEFPPGTPPAATNFPRRNRIISGMSLGTLVVEASVKSGSLITARYAWSRDGKCLQYRGHCRILKPKVVTHSLKLGQNWLKLQKILLKNYVCIYQPFGSKNWLKNQLKIHPCPPSCNPPSRRCHYLKMMQNITSC